MSTQLLAYHGDPTIKAKYLARIRSHAAADEIIQGRYWENGKGCAVGCTIHSSRHGDYETELGIPIALARLEDTLFEGQKKGDSKTFPERFLMAAKVGADLSCVHWKFLHWLLTEELAERDHPLVRDAIRQCADMLVPLTKGEPVDASAASAAWSAAESAAWSAAQSAAESAAWSAAERAAWSAASAASAAKSAAESAASAAWSAAQSAAWSAASAAYKRMAEKLLELMSEAPLVKPWIAMGGFA